MALNKTLVDWFKGFLWASVLLGGGYIWGFDKGETKGLTSYHDMCYNVGGWVIGNDGTVVQCQPLSKIPKEEYNRNFKGT